MLLIGVGNTMRCDDGVGVATVRSAAVRLSGIAQVLELSGEGTELMQAWDEIDEVMVVDAVASGGEPGTVYRIDPGEVEVPSKFFRYSSHLFGVAEAVELSRTLGKLPRWMVLYGIEGGDWSAGETLSPKVADGARECAEQIVEEVMERRGSA